MYCCFGRGFIRSKGAVIVVVIRVKNNPVIGRPAATPHKPSARGWYTFCDQVDVEAFAATVPKPECVNTGIIAAMDYGHIHTK